MQRGWATIRGMGAGGWIAAGLLAVAFAASIAPQAGCSDTPRAHIFVARVYDPVHHCVSVTEGIDVVAGAGPDGPACPPICIVDSTGDIGISGMCPPYPYGDTIEGLDGGPLDPTCTLALAAYDCNVTCDADAGPDGGPPITDAAACLSPESPDAAMPEAGEASAPPTDSGSIPPEAGPAGDGGDAGVKDASRG
jgi:hypothetical protein